jgi:hypothetical protein
VRGSPLKARRPGHHENEGFDAVARDRHRDERHEADEDQPEQREQPDREPDREHDGSTGHGVRLLPERAQREQQGDEERARRLGDTASISG